MPMTKGSRNERWLDGDDERALGRDVLAPDAAEAEVQVEERLQDAAGQPVDERVDAAPARTIEKGLAIHAFDTRHWWPRLQFDDADRSRTDSTRSPRRSHRRRGVVRAGAARHARLRRRLLRRELLGKAVTRGPAWPAVGFALHLLNGAAFGAAYANVAPRLPLPVLGARPRPGHGRAPLDLADDRRRRSRPPRAQGLSGPLGQQPRLRPGHLAPPVLRHRPGRVGAPLQRRPTTPASRPTSTSPPPTATATSSTPWARRSRRQRYARARPTPE